MALYQDSTNYARAGFGPQSDGIIVNQASEKLGFYGTAPVAVQTASSALTGASDTTAIAAAVNAINTALKAFGLTA